MTKSSPRPDGKAMYTLSNVLTAPPSKPCQQCQNLIPDRTSIGGSVQIDTAWEIIDEYPSYPTLEISSQAGCGLCGLIRHVLCFMATPEARSYDKNGTHYLWEGDEDNLLKISWDRKIKIKAHFLFFPFKPLGDHVDFGLSGLPPQYNGMVTRLRLHYFTEKYNTLSDGKGNSWRGSVVDIPVCDSPDLFSGDPEKRCRLPSTTTLSDENVVMMRQWIDGCVNTHGDGCSVPSQQASWIPTRLVEIHPGETSDDITLRLVETSSHKNCHQIKEFAALSHMWGDMTVSPPLRTFKSNLETMKKEIKLAELPLNFSHAIHVCIRLNIKYLWIDSLCIIQDSAEDWKYEAGLMHMVYQLALVTIVATSSESCHDGFLRRDIASSPAVKIPYSTGGGGDQFFILYYHKRALDNNRIHTIDLSKWNTRGWTMQERSLSTRSIHFGHAKIFFECRNCLLSEENEPEEEFATSSSVLWPRGASVSSHELDDRWENFVFTYCDRNLTHGTDKLPAIQSVAAQMASQTGYEYFSFAGVWRHNLPAHLLWHSWIGRAEVPKKARAPSWSWAALDASIIFSYSLADSLSMPKRSQLQWLSSKLARHPFEVVEVAVDPVLGGYIKVSALTRPISTFRRVGKTGKWRSFFPYDMFVTEGNNTTVFAHGRLDLDGDSSALKTTNRCLYMHISNDTRSTGLILEKVPGRSTSSHGEVWKRVGVASLFSDESGLLLFEEPFGNSQGQAEVTII
ncbi:hypothetical protein ACJZ2D_013991 [Fusarium nematophilum]